MVNISKLQLLQYWADRKLTHMTEWEEKLTSRHSKNYRIRLPSTWNTSSLNVWVIPCLPWQYYSDKDTQQPTSARDVTWTHKWYNICTNALMRESVAYIQRQYIHLQKWLEARNMDPNIAIILVDTTLYIAGERNDLIQCPNIILHLKILWIGWPSIILGFIPTYLAHTHQTYFTHIGSKTNWTQMG